VTVPPFRVLVLCTGNSARSQIGEALFTVRGAARVQGPVEAESAGSRPAPRVNPFAIEVLAANGIEWGAGAPKHVDAMMSHPFDLAVTVCDNARDACPIFPNARAHVHWGLPDPADFAEPDAARRAFAETFAALSARVDDLLALPLASMSPSDISEAAAAIHAAHSAREGARD
jgi:arsenate reductase